MPKITEMLPSKYLKKEDCTPPILVTITGVSQENVGQGDDMEEKWILSFKETKGMVLNSTNLRLLEMITGSDDSDDWTGKQVVAYSDPNISFGGKLVGGIRLRAPKTAPKHTTSPKAQTVEELDSDIPF